MERLNRVDGELQRNGGNSVKDQVVRTGEKIDDMEYRVSAIETRQCEIQKQIKDHVEQPSIKP
jgi:predicted  nucleic acid-binding Zn-ribbon protein